MKKTILETYCLAVCFIIVICFSINIIKGIYNIIEITNPSFTLTSQDFYNFQSNEQFCLTYAYKDQCKNKTNEQVIQLRKDAYTFALENESRTGLQGLIVSLIILIVTVLMFVPHWLIARKARL